MKQTKIVCSISDRRCSEEFLRKLFFAGMNVVRMNTAHATREGMMQIINNVRAVSPHIGILIDTKGPEVRTTGVAQMIIARHETAELEPATLLGATGRGEGGYGHTGVE